MYEIKEIEIDNVIDYVKYIFQLKENLNEIFDNDMLFKFVDEIQKFQDEIEKLNNNNFESNISEQESKLKYELIKILGYLNRFPILDTLMSLRRANFKLKKTDNNSNMNQFELFYRGVYNGAKFNLLPSVFRSNNYGKEDQFYHFLKAKCTSELNGRSHLDTLVTLQHYDCPTRLLDITSNPLVALYFACQNYGCFKCDKADYGYVYVFANARSKLLFKDSDRVIMLSCLARFSKEEQEEIYDECIKLILKKGIGAKFDANRLPHIIEKLYHEIKIEVSFEKRILARDLLLNYFVQPDISNKRIDKQSGAFIISGLSNNQQEIEEKIMNNVFYKIKIKNQQRVLKELDSLNINEGSLFPELDKVSKYFVSKF